jgi:hypothetical protein
VAAGHLRAVVVLFLAGVVMFAYPVGTDLYSQYQQGSCRRRSTTRRCRPPTPSAASRSATA